MRKRADRNRQIAIALARRDPRQSSLFGEGHEDELQAIGDSETFKARLAAIGNKLASLYDSLGDEDTNVYVADNTARQIIDLKKTRDWLLLHHKDVELKAVRRQERHK